MITTFLEMTKTSPDDKEWCLGKEKRRKKSKVDNFCPKKRWKFIAWSVHKETLV